MTEQIKERYMLSVERIKKIQSEKTVDERFQDFFVKVSGFIAEIHEVGMRLEEGSREQLTLKELSAENENLYEDILGENYGHSYANPAYAVSVLGEDYGKILSFLYTEIRSEIVYVFERKQLYLTICNELFIEIYNCFEERKEPAYEELKDIIYWYASDYTDVFVADRIVEQIDPGIDFAVRIITESDLTDIRYLYAYGEYISDNERKTAEYLNRLPEEVICTMADTYTEGYRMCFVNGRKDLSIKSTVNIRYTLGFERVVKKAIENFAKMGLKPVIYRTAVSVLTKRKHHKIGYYGGIANKQYDYDHRADQGLFMDKKFIERKLDVMKNVYEKHKELAAGMAGPAVMEVFGEIPFVPLNKAEVVHLSEKQEQLELLYDSKSGQMVNRYIKGEERGFTIIAYPVPEIGEKYEEIFGEVIRINTLDAKLYESVQQTMIDALDEGEYVHILGKDNNKTDLKVQLYKLGNPEKETIFENCVADANIPVGEVFTSPVLEGTNGTLFVSKVYLDDLQYRDLEMEFEDGKIKTYTCSNFETEEENRKYMQANVLFHNETLPLGEFAIGTNTTAYVVAKKYGIEDKMPILIAEKMGPHFAVGDTCYSWSEETRIYNPNGKEIVAKDNSVSILRKEDVSKAYFHCHTDITIPYEELAEISVVKADGSKITILEDGRFVLEGTEVLNEPFGEMN